MESKYNGSPESDDELGSDAQLYAEDAESDRDSEKSSSPRIHNSRSKGKSQSRADETAGSDEELDAITRDTSVARRFRVNSKCIMLTYAQSAPLTETECYNVINSRWAVKAYIIATEQHTDGKDHIHFYIEFVNKINVTNPQAFDIKVSDGSIKHPNVRTVQRKHRSAVQHYVMKSGRFTQDKVDLFPTSKNFQKAQMDLKLWLRYRKQVELVAVKWPITLPDGNKISRPVTENEKKRHWVIKGSPDMGKTTWLNNQFEGQKVWLRPACERNPFDDYEGEEVLLYDDVKVDQLRDELIAVSNYYKVLTRVPGNTRYMTKHFELKQLRTIIIIGNDWPTWKGDAWAEARFNYLDLQHWVPDWVLMKAAAEWSPQQPVMQLASPEASNDSDVMTAAELLAMQEAERRAVRRSGKEQQDPYEYQESQDPFE